MGLNFFSNGLLQTLLPRLPEIKAGFDLGDGLYGLVMAAAGVGALSAGPLPARFIARFGALKVALVGTWISASMLIVAGFAPHPAIFAAAFFVFGFSDSATDAAQNTQGVAVQVWSRRTIINSLHGTWSLGAALAGLIGAGAAGLKVPIGIHATVMALVIFVVAVACYRLGTIPAEVRAKQAAAKAHTDRLAAPSWRRLLPVLPLAAIALCGMVPEDVAYSWGAVYLVDQFGTPYSAAGLAVVAMLASQIIGRFTADVLTDRFGGWQVATFGACLVAVGGVLIVTTPHAALVYVGFALSGYGTASLIPTAYAAAGHLPGIASGTGITLVSFIMRIGITTTSPIIGGVAEVAGLRAGLAIGALAGLVAAALCWRAIPRSEKQGRAT